jgi:hypothetical protein
MLFQVVSADLWSLEEVTFFPNVTNITQVMASEEELAIHAAAVDCYENVMYI